MRMRSARASKTISELARTDWRKAMPSLFRLRRNSAQGTAGGQPSRWKLARHSTFSAAACNDAEKLRAAINRGGRAALISGTLTDWSRPPGEGNKLGK